METVDRRIELTEDDIKRFMEEFRKRVEDFHSTLRVSPIGEHFEDLVHQAFVRAEIPGVRWDGLDHKSGADLFFDQNLSLPFEWAEKPLKAPSVKTNVKRQQDPIRSDISGERLGNMMMGEDKDTALEEVLNLLANEVNYNYYILLTRRTQRGKDYNRKALRGEGFEEYEVFLIPASYFHQFLYPVSKWTHTSKKWKRKIEKGFNLVITKSMAHQYWIQGVPYDDIKEYSLGSVEISHASILDERYPAEDIAKRKVK